MWFLLESAIIYLPFPLVTSLCRYCSTDRRCVHISVRWRKCFCSLRNPIRCQLDRRYHSNGPNCIQRDRSSFKLRSSLKPSMLRFYCSGCLSYSLPFFWCQSRRRRQFCRLFYCSGILWDLLHLFFTVGLVIDAIGVGANGFVWFLVPWCTYVTLLSSSISLRSFWLLLCSFVRAFWPISILYVYLFFTYGSRKFINLLRVDTSFSVIENCHKGFLSCQLMEIAQVCRCGATVHNLAQLSLCASFWWTLDAICQSKRFLYPFQKGFSPSAMI